jgi:hypothetical protein
VRGFDDGCDVWRFGRKVMTDEPFPFGEYEEDKIKIV